MTGRRWTVDDEGVLVLDASSNDPLRFTRQHMSEITDAEYTDLAQCVRDADPSPFDQEAAAIVVALALHPAPVSAGPPEQPGMCVLCDAEARTPLSDVIHHPDCVWLRAKALMADQARQESTTP